MSQIVGAGLLVGLGGLLMVAVLIGCWIDQLCNEQGLVQTGRMDEHENEIEEAAKIGTGEVEEQSLEH